MLQLSEAADLHILNGRTADHADGQFTCRTAQGSSVVDYFLASTVLLNPMPAMVVGDKCAESDHCPLTLQMSLQAAPCSEAENRPQPSTTENTVTIEKIRFDALQASAIQAVPFNISSILYFNASPSQCCLASALQSCIAQAALSSFGRPRGKFLHKSNQKWYDEECKSARAALRNTETEMHEHVALLKAYKQLLRRKRRAWHAKTQRELCEMASRNPSSFWRQYNERQSHTCSITREQWKSSFEALYKAPTTTAPADNPVKPPQSPIPSPIPDSHHAAQAPAFDFLNADITHDEVEAALKRLKRNKAAGVDGIRAEHILDASEVLLDPLVQTFNQLLNKGVPPAWCTGLIHPIFKAGDPEDAGNYRGITVVVILAKLYAMVLETRASRWAEHSKCRAKGQAGFRKDHRTSDQVFIIQALVRDRQSNKSVNYTVALLISKRHLIWFHDRHYGASLNGGV